ncbi:HAD family hydrolase [Primorskyibacter sp. S187A]|uniref:HAD family hydrolase n=1 Tax=Primorskyibacter sp. S187A TaxID=3415130 RepID=UPI003C7A8E98
MSTITTIGFDADDTLWHHERFYHSTQAQFASLLADYTDAQTLEARLLEAERRNLGHYGFGVKGFTLSMIETAIEVTQERVPARVISQLIKAGQEMLAHPIELLPGAREAVTELSRSHDVVLITKGDLLDQERKLAQSGLGDLFDAVEIVSHKTAGVYANIFAQHGRGAPRGLMVGNSMASDVVPMIEAGGFAAHVPSGFDWALEAAEVPKSPRFHRLRTLSDLPDLLTRLD